MSDQPTTPPAPATPEELAALEKAHSSYYALAEELAELELAKPRILMSLQRTREAKEALLEEIRVSRGLPKGANFEIDPQTGAITVHGLLVPRRGYALRHEPG